MPDFFDEVVAPSLKEGADVNTLKEGFTQFFQKQTEDFTAGLRQNRDNLLNEKKTLQQQYDEYKNRYKFLEGKDIDSEKFNNMISELETYKASAGKTDEEFRQQLMDQYEKGKKSFEEAITPQLNSLKMQLDETAKMKENFQKKYQNYMAENVLRSTLADMGVEYDDYWFEGMKNKAKFEFGEEGIQDISVYHDNGYIPLGDWKKIFPTTERGKKMIKVLPNMGGSGPGSKGSNGEASSLEEIAKIADPRARQEALRKLMAKK